MSKNKVVPKHISLYPEDWQAVDEVAEPLGMNTSQGVRYIIREWQRLVEALKSGVQSPSAAPHADYSEPR